MDNQVQKGKQEIPDTSEKYEVLTDSSLKLYYELRLLTHIALKGVSLSYNFEIGTKLGVTEHFDNIIFSYSKEDDGQGEKLRFIQANHVQLHEAASTKITSKELLNTPGGQYDLRLYFQSFYKLSDNPLFADKTIQDVIIATNIGFTNSGSSESFDLLERSDDGAFKYLKVLPEDDLFNDGGYLHKFVDQTVPEGRKVLVDKLREVVDDTQELDALALELVKSFVGKPYDTDLLRNYCQVLATFVVDVEQKKLQSQFVDSTWTEDAPKNMHLFRSYFEKHTAIKINPWEDIKSMTNTDATVYFGGYPHLLDPVDYANTMATLILQNHRNAIEIKTSKDEEIHKLAGHVLVGEAGNYKFHSGFLNEKPLPGNLGIFRSSLKDKITNHDKLSQLIFKISDFKTCEENDIETFLEPVLPEAYATDANINSFLDKLVFATSQPNVNKLYVSTRKNIQKLIDFSDTNSSCEDLEAVIFIWVKNYGTFKTKTDIRALMDSFQSNETNLFEHETDAATLSDLIFNESSNFKPCLFSAFASGSVAKVNFTVDYIRKHYVRFTLKQQLLLKNESDESILGYVAQYVENPEVVKLLFQLLKTELDESSISLMLLEEDDEGDHPFSAALRLNSHKAIIQVFFDFFENEVEYDILCCLLSKGNHTILHCACSAQTNAEVIKMVFSFLKKHLKPEEFKKFLRIPYENDNNFLNLIFLYQPENEISSLIDFIESETDSATLSDLMCSQTSHCVSSLFAAFSSGSVAKVNFLVQYIRKILGKSILRDQLLLKNAQNFNILDCVISIKNTAMLNLLFELLKTELDENSINLLLWNETVNYSIPLRRAISIIENKEIVQVFLNFIENETEHDTLCRILTCISNGDHTILHWASHTKMNAEVIKIVFSFLKKHLKPEDFKNLLRTPNTFEDNFLNLIFLYQPENEISSFISFIESETDSATLSELIFSQTRNCRPCLFVAFASRSVSTVNFLVEHIRKFFGKNNLKEQLLFKTVEDFTILDFVVALQHAAMLELLFELLKKELDKNSINLLLLNKNINGDTPLSGALNKPDNKTIIRNYLTFIEHEIEADILHQILTSTANDQTTALHRASFCKMNVDVIKILLIFVKKHLKSEEFKEFLRLTNDNDDNFLNFILKNQPENEIPSLIDFIESQMDSVTLSDLILSKSNNCRPTLFVTFLSRSVAKVNFLVEYIRKRFDKKSLREQFFLKIQENFNIFDVVLTLKSTEMLQLLFELLKTELDKNSINSLLLNKNVNGDTPLSGALRNIENKDVLQFFLNFIENEIETDILRQILNSISNHESTILHVASRGKTRCVDVVTMVLIFLKKHLNSKAFNSFLRLPNENADNFLSVIFYELTETEILSLLGIIETETDANTVSDLIFSQSSSCRPSLFMVFSSGSVSKVNFCVDYIRKNLEKSSLREQLNYKSDLNLNFLDVLAFSKNAEMLKLGLDLLRTESDKKSISLMFLEKNSFGESTLFTSLRYTDKAIIEPLLNFIECELEANTINRILNLTTEGKSTILHFAINNKMSVDIIKVLLNFIKRNLNSNEFNSFLCLPNESNEHFLNIIFKLWSENEISSLLDALETVMDSASLANLFYSSASQCRPCLFSVFASRSVSKINFTVEYIRKHIGKSSLKEQLLYRTKENFTTLDVHVKNPPLLEIGFELLKTELDKKSISLMFLEKNIFGENTFGTALRQSVSKEITQRFLDFIENEMEAGTLCRILTSISQDKSTILHLASLNENDADVIKIVLVFMKKHLDSKEFNKILRLTNDRDETFFKLIIKHQLENVFFSLMSFIEVQLGTATLSELIFCRFSQYVPSLFTAFMAGSASKVITLVKYIRINFDQTSLKEQILFKTAHNFNILTMLMIAKMPTMLELGLKLLKKEVDESSINFWLLEKKKFDDHPLSTALRQSGNKEVIQVLLNFIQKEIGEATKFRILTSISERNATILHVAATTEMNVDVIKLLLVFIKKHMTSNDFNELLHFVRTFNGNFLNYIVSYQPENEILSLFNFIKDKTSPAMLSELIFSQATLPCLISAYASQSVTRINFMVNYIRNNFHANSMKEQLRYKNPLSANILDYLLHFISAATLKMLFELLKVELSRESINEMLMELNYFGNTPLCTSILKNEDKDIIEVFLNFIEN